MNRINPEKLLLSKWTAVSPSSGERHFIVTRLQRDDNDRVISCSLQAVLTRRESQIDWHELSDSDHWQMGWQRD